MQNPSVKRYLDRRIKSRHKAPSLRVHAVPLKLFPWFRRPTSFHCVDFNRYGMAIESHQFFKKGEKLSFRFRGRYIHENGIEGEITSVARSRGVYRYGVIFTYAISPKHYRREVDNAVSRIEGIFRQMNNPIDPAHDTAD